METLILQAFEIYSKKNLSNQVLRKLVKLHNSQNVNYPRYINVSRHSRVLSWVSFFVQKSKVSLKISLKFPSTFFDNSKCCFSSSLFKCVFGIDIEILVMDWSLCVRASEMASKLIIKEIDFKFLANSQ